jgi:hypothetical protein
VSRALSEPADANDTERAALKVLVRVRLTSVVFDVCYGPFTAAIPMLR